MSATLLGAPVFLVLMAGLFMPLEYLAPGAEHRASARSMGVAAALFILNTVLMELLGGPLLDGLASMANAPASRSVGRVVLVFFAADLLGYWIHRAMHRVPLLWRFHRVHHEAVELHWLDAWRQHPVDFVVHGLVVGLPGALLGASLSDLGSVVLLRKAFTTLLHANVRWRFGPLYWLVASPVFHQRHHSADARDDDSHFAGTFPLWDLLFGTAKLERPAIVVTAHGEPLAIPTDSPTADRQHGSPVQAAHAHCSARRARVIAADSRSGRRHDDTKTQGLVAALHDVFLHGW